MCVSSRPAIVAERIQCLDWQGLGHVSDLELGVESQLNHLDSGKGGWFSNKAEVLFWRLEWMFYLERK